MYKLIGMGFQFLAAGIVFLAGATEYTASSIPGVLGSLVTDIAFGFGKGGADRKI